MMKFRSLLFVIMLIAAAVGTTGCAATQEQSRSPRMCVPWSGSVTRLAALSTTPAHGDGSALLADDYAVITRDERAALVAAESVSVSSFTTYTYDAQPLGVPGVGGSWGYRQRWVVQTGVSTP